MSEFDFSITGTTRRWTDERGLWIEQTTTINGLDSVMLYGPIDVHSLAVAHTPDGTILLMGKPIPAHHIVDERKSHATPVDDEPTQLGGGEDEA